VSNYIDGDSVEIKREAADRAIIEYSDDGQPGISMLSCCLLLLTLVPMCLYIFTVCQKVMPFLYLSFPTFVRCII